MHNVQSPRIDDSAIEQEIQAKGLTAPRITPQDLEDNIERIHYFTASDGLDGADIKAMRLEDLCKTLEIRPMAEDPDLSRTTIHGPLTLLTFCVIVLKNGFTVTGESACASPENFDAEVGRKIALANAKQKIWPLMGYVLKEKLKGA